MVLPESAIHLISSPEIPETQALQLVEKTLPYITL